jgi:hypothetical protein
MKVTMASIRLIVISSLLSIAACVGLYVITGSYDCQSTVFTRAQEERQFFDTVETMKIVGPYLFACNGHCTQAGIKSAIGDQYSVELLPDKNILTIRSVKIILDEGKVVYFGPVYDIR